MTSQPEWYELVARRLRHDTPAYDSKGDCEVYTLFSTEAIEGSSRVTLEAG
jgi:hypothetical protein